MLLSRILNTSQPLFYGPKHPQEKERTHKEITDGYDLGRLAQAGADMGGLDPAECVHALARAVESRRTDITIAEAVDAVTAGAHRVSPPLGHTALLAFSYIRGVASYQPFGDLDAAMTVGSLRTEYQAEIAGFWQYPIVQPGVEPQSSAPEA